MMHAQPVVYTIGHSTRSMAEFLALLRESSIQCLVDVRRLPGSRAFPQFDRPALHRALHAAGIAYVWAGAALGGRRGRTLPKGDMRNAYWTHPSFRRYADYALSESFRQGFERLVRRAASCRCGIMCAEAVWWRCHRRIITDYLLAAGHPVFHIMTPGKTMAASATPGARYHDGVVTYPRAPVDAR